MSRILRAVLLFPLLCALGLGCRSVSSSSSLPPSGQSLPPNGQPLPSPTPPSWESPNKTTFTSPAPSNAKLAPKMELAWSIYADGQSQIPVMAGESPVGPDG